MLVVSYRNISLPLIEDRIHFSSEMIQKALRIKIHNLILYLNVDLS